MTWVRIDDAAPLHPKLLRAGAEAAWLWVAGMAHCNRHTTDGRIDDAALPSLYPCDGWGRAKIRRLANRLVQCGLWHREADGYRVHDYDHYQEEALRSVVQERREYERQRKRRQRAAKRRQRESKDPGDIDTVSHRDSPGQSPETDRGQSSGQVRGQDRGSVPALSQPPGPARPDPSRPAAGQDRDTDTPEADARSELLLRLWQLWDQGHLQHRASPAGNRAMWERELAVIAGAVEQHASHRGHHPSDVAEQLMSRVWSDPWVQANGQRARLGHVAKHVGHYLATESSGDAPADDLTKRVRELLAEQEQLEGEVDPDSRQRLEQVRSELSDLNARRRAQGGARAAAAGGGA